jgi:hypothetical protein
MALVALCSLVIGISGEDNNITDSLLPSNSVTAVPPSESFGNKVLHSDVQLTRNHNQYGAITIANYKKKCDCTNQKACNEPPDYAHWDSSRADFYDRTLEEQTTAGVGAMMLLTRGCYTPTVDKGPGDACPLKYKMMVDAVKRAGQDNVTKFGLWDDNAKGWAQIRNRNKKLPDNTPFDFADQSSWKYVFNYNYKVFFETIPHHMWYRIDNKPVIAMWIFRKSSYPKSRNHIGAFMAWLKAEFKKTFGVEPYLVAPKSIFEDGSSAKSTDITCAHEWFSAAREVSYTVTTNNGVQCGAMSPGYRDACSVAPCGKSCRTIERKNGATLAKGLSANSKSEFALMEGWNDVRENAGYYRSKAWSTPSLYINTVRNHANPAPLTLRLQAETADHFHDTTAENIGGEYRQDSLDVGRLLGASGGWFVGWTEPSEWIEFKGIQLGDGIHRFTARCASDEDGNRIRLDMPTLRSTVVPNTGGLEQYEHVHLGEVKLEVGGGEHALRIVFETGGVNVDWIFVKRQAQ